MSKKINLLDINAYAAIGTSILIIIVVLLIKLFH